MEGGKGRCYQHPGMEALVRIDEWHKKSQQQVQQQYAPVFAHLDQHFAQVGLHIITTQQERNGQQERARRQPDGALYIGYFNCNMGQKIYQA